MKKNILSAIILTGGLLVLLCVFYPLTVWTIAQLSPNQGRGFVIEHNGKTHYHNSGQSFTQDRYFWSRPSAVDYNAAGSGASNKAATNPAYLKEVEQRITDFIAKNPTIKKEDIPVDLLTASGSGLDPHFSVQAAKIQVDRIATARGLSTRTIHQLIDEKTEKPLFGLFGPQKINVLELNIALDQLTKR